VLLGTLILLTYYASSALKKAGIRFIADNIRYVCLSTRQRSTSSCQGHH